MNSSLDMSLDDLIKSNKQSGRGRGRGTGRGRAAGSRRGAFSGPRAAAGPLGVRRAVNRANTRSSPYQIAKPFSRTPGVTWQNDLFEDAVSGAARSLGIETGTKLYISNLDYGVSNEDIKELFCEVGDLKRSAIHYDRSGRSKGTAEVLFTRKVDAFAALKRYNNVQLDGKPMKIELIGTNLQLDGAQTMNGFVATAGRGHTAVMTGGRGRGFGYRRFRGRGRGQGRRLVSDSKVMSLEDLDEDLNKYHHDAMQAS